MSRAAGWIPLWIAGLCVTTAAACPVTLPVRKAHVNQHVLELEVATSESERKCGLSGRESLPVDRGMLFVLPRRMPVEFWMSDMTFPVALAFLDQEGKILDIQTTIPGRPELYRSPGPVDYVIEVNRDWFAEHEVHVGDVLGGAPGTSRPGDAEKLQPFRQFGDQ